MELQSVQIIKAQKMISETLDFTSDNVIKFILI